MKKIFNQCSVWMCVLLMVGFLSSCDRDVERGMALSGRWFGDLGMMVNGYPARGSDIEFIPTSYDYTSGYGTEIDYYGRYGTMTVRHHFDWYVNNGVIYLRFDDPGLDCMIRNYSLSPEYFRGYMDGVYESSYFSLRAYEKYWDDYGYWGEDYSYPYWGYDYYVKGESTHGQTPVQTEPQCVRRFNVPAEGVEK